MCKTTPGMNHTQNPLHLQHYPQSIFSKFKSWKKEERDEMRVEFKILQKSSHQTTSKYSSNPDLDLPGYIKQQPSHLASAVLIQSSTSSFHMVVAAATTKLKQWNLPAFSCSDIIELQQLTSGLSTKCWPAPTAAAIRLQQQPTCKASAFHQTRLRLLSTTTCHQTRCKVRGGVHCVHIRSHTWSNTITVVFLALLQQHQIIIWENNLELN